MHRDDIIQKPEGPAIRKREMKGDTMSSKKYAKNNDKNKGFEFTSYYSPAKVWFVRIIVILLCITVAITLIPSVFF